MTDGKRAIAVVGCGGMGGGHAIAISTGTGAAVWNITGIDKSAPRREGDTDISRKLKLSGVYDSDPVRQKWARDQGLFAYDSYGSLLSDGDVDAVLIATPNHLHKEQAIRAMRAGKHVLCEKPVMMSSRDLAEVMAVSKETGMIFYPRQNRRWDKDYLIVKKIYDDKLIGDVINVECRIHGSRGIPGDWRGVKEYGGGMMLDWGVHILDRIIMMMSPEKVKKVFTRFNHITNDDVDDGFIMHLTFEGGLTAIMEVGTSNFIGLPLWYVTGKEGSAVVYNWKNEGKIVRLDSWEDKDATPILAGEGLTKTMAPRDAASTSEFPLPEIKYDANELYSNFVDAINGDAAQLVTAEEALRCLRLMEAAFESDAKSTVVDFE